MLSPPANFQGREVGIVEGRCDPARLGRVRVRITGIHSSKIPTKKLPWALPDTVAGFQCGIFFVPPIGSWVRISFNRGDPNYPIYSGGWWGSSSDLGKPEVSAASGLSAHYQIKDKFRLPTSWFGSQKQRSKDSILRAEPDGDPADSPDNFTFTSPLQKRLELDDRLGRERIVLADFHGNGLFVNCENSAVSLEAFKGIRQKDPSPYGLTINPKEGTIQSYTAGGWIMTKSDVDNVFEVASPGGMVLRVDQKRARIEAWTQRGGRIVLDDPTSKVEITTPGGRRFGMDDLNSICAIHGINTNQYVLIDDLNERVEVFGKMIHFKSETDIRLSAGGNILADTAPTGAIYLNSDVLDLSKTFSGLESLTKPSRMPIAKRPYDYQYYTKAEEA